MLRMRLRVGLARHEIKGCPVAMLNGRRLLLLQLNGVSTQSVIPGAPEVTTLAMAVCGARLRGQRDSQPRVIPTSHRQKPTAPPEINFRCVSDGLTGFRAALSAALSPAKAPFIHSRKQRHLNT